MTIRWVLSGAAAIFRRPTEKFTSSHNDAFRVRYRYLSNQALVKSKKPSQSGRQPLMLELMASSQTWSQVKCIGASSKTIAWHRFRASLRCFSS